MVKIAVPFATLSAFFFFNIDISHAATSTLDQSNLIDLNGNLFQGFDAEDYFPDKKLSFFKKIKWYFASGDELIFNFLADIFGLIFRVLAFVGLQTPTWLFTNEITKSIVKATSFASVFYTISTLMYESFARMLSKPFKLEFTPFRSVVKKMPVAFALGALSPLILNYLAKLANSLSLLLNVNTAKLISNPALNGFESSMGEIISLLIFDVSMIYLLVPIVVKNSVRWWDMFTLTLMSPLILVESMFDKNYEVVKNWFNRIKELLSAQLVNSAYIALLAIILSATNSTGLPFISKMILIVGGMHRIANPPEFLLKANGFEDKKDYGKGFWKDNEYSPINLGKKAIGIRKMKRETVLERRRKAGKRSV